MAANPVFAVTPHVELSQVTAANTNRDGTGTVVTCFTSGASGSRIERIRIKAAGTSTATMLRFYLSDGTSTRLIRETLAIALTPSQTVQTFEAFEVLGIVVPTGWTVKASVHTAETYNIVVEGSDF